MPLNRQRIIAAAVKLIDEQGLQGLSMRRLGASLEVEAMSLYYHVANKDDVLDGVLEEVLSQVEFPDRELTWEEQLAILGRNLREVGMRHPGVLSMLTARVVTGVASLAPLRCAYDILLRAGLDDDMALAASLSLSSLVLGSLVIDGAHAEAVKSGRLVAAALHREHPAELRELGQALALWDGTRGFEVGLMLFIGGIRAHPCGGVRAR